MLKILIAEDDPMIADMNEEVLVEHGYEVCGIGRTVNQAVTLGRRHNPDLAIIDIHMADSGLGTDVAAQLADMGQLGILYVTGNVSGDHLDTARGHARLTKPYRFADLLRSLEIVLELIVTGHASTPFPDGFGVLPRAMADPMEALHA